MKAAIIPKNGEVIDFDWRNDIDYEPFGTDEEEKEYISPETVSRTSIEKIKSTDLRQKLEKRGKKVGGLFNLNELEEAA